MALRRLISSQKSKITLAGLVAAEVHVGRVPLALAGPRPVAAQRMEVPPADLDRLRPRRRLPAETFIFTLNFFEFLLDL